MPRITAPRRLLLSALAAGVLAPLALAGPADAHRLSVGKAKVAAETTAERYAGTQEDAVDFGVDDCTRAGAHQLACGVFVAFDDGESTWECTSTITVRFRSATSRALKRTAAAWVCEEPVAVDPEDGAAAGDDPEDDPYAEDLPEDAESALES